jgi:hypothetical protein
MELKEKIQTILLLKESFYKEKQRKEVIDKVVKGSFSDERTTPFRLMILIQWRRKT